MEVEPQAIQFENPCQLVGIFLFPELLLNNPNPINSLILQHDKAVDNFYKAKPTTHATEQVRINLPKFFYNKLCTGTRTESFG